MANKNIVWSMLVVFLLFAASVAAVTIDVVVVDPVPAVYGGDVTFTATLIDVDGDATVELTISGTTIEDVSLEPTATPDEYEVTLETADIGVADEYEFTITATDDSTSDEFDGNFEIVNDETPPVINAVAVDVSPVVYGDDFTITISATDDVEITDIFVAFATGAIYYPEETGNADEYAVTIDTSDATDEGDFGAVGSYDFTVIVADDAGNSNTDTGSIEIVDETDPVIDPYEVSPSSTPDYGETITIIATITDYFGISSVSLEIDGDATSYTLEDSDGNDVYESNAIDTTALGAGVHTYYITAEDANGNSASVFDIFFVVDDDDPVITGVGDVADPAEYGSVVTFTATVTDNDEVSTVTVEIQGVSYPMGYDASSGSYMYALDSSVLSLGTQSYTVTATDASGNEAEDTTGSLTVVDNALPSIIVLGDASVTVEAGSPYTDAGATATDNYDGDLTDSIVTVNPVNSNVVGIYTVTYDVEDSSGNNAPQQSRTVDVVDTTSPVITVLGDNPTTVEVNTVYADAGATAYDAADGDVTSSIATTNPVNTAILGTYTVMYSVADRTGNLATATRTVDVVDTENPTINSVSLSATRVSEGDVITFTADVTDNDGVASVVLTTNSGTYPMSNGGSGDVYTADVDTTGFALGTYAYTITATDVNGRTASASGSYEVTVVSPITVLIRADKTSGEENLDVSFSSVVTGGVSPLTYSWNFGDGSTDSNKNNRYVFKKEGTFTVTLTVRDQYGNEGSDTEVITVTAEEASADPRNNMKIEGVSFTDDVVAAGETLEAKVSVENIGESKLKDVSITISIPELGIWATTTAENVREGDVEKKTLALDIPEDVAPGVYDVRIVISNDDMKRVKHRDVEII